MLEPNKTSRTISCLNPHTCTSAPPPIYAAVHTVIPQLQDIRLKRKRHAAAVAACGMRMRYAVCMRMRYANYQIPCIRLRMRLHSLFLNRVGIYVQQNKNKSFICEEGTCVHVGPMATETHIGCTRLV